MEEEESLHPVELLTQSSHSRPPTSGATPRIPNGAVCSQKVRSVYLFCDCQLVDPHIWAPHSHHLSPIFLSQVTFPVSIASTISHTRPPMKADPPSAAITACGSSARGSLRSPSPSPCWTVHWLILCRQPLPLRDMSSWEQHLGYVQKTLFQSSHPSPLALTAKAIKCNVRIRLLLRPPLRYQQAAC